MATVTLPDPTKLDADTDSISEARPEIKLTADAVVEMGTSWNNNGGSFGVSGGFDAPNDQTVGDTVTSFTPTSNVTRIQITGGSGSNPTLNLNCDLINMNDSTNDVWHFIYETSAGLIGYGTIDVDYTITTDSATQTYLAQNKTIQVGSSQGTYHKITKIYSGYQGAHYILEEVTTSTRYSGDFE